VCGICPVAYDALAGWQPVVGEGSGGWSHHEAQRAQSTASGGKWTGRESGSSGKSRGRGCDRLQRRSHGRNGVGSHEPARAIAMPPAGKPPRPSAPRKNARSRGFPSRLRGGAKAPSRAEPARASRRHRCALHRIAVASRVADVAGDPASVPRGCRSDMRSTPPSPAAWLDLEITRAPARAP
jgi:hypothetical protein